MNSDLYFDGKKYISSSRAAKISGYVNDYVGQLCRDGKLDCRMIGRSWYVSFDSIISHKNSNIGSSKNRPQKSPKELIIVNPPLVASVVNFEPSVFVPESSVSAPAQAVEIVLPVLSEDFSVANPVFLAAPLNATTEPLAQVVVTPAMPVNIAVISTHHEVFGKKFPSVVGGVLAVMIAFIGFSAMLSADQRLASVYSEAGQNISRVLVSGSAAATLAVVDQSFVKKASSRMNTFAVSFYESINSIFLETKSRLLVMIGSPPTSDLAEKGHSVEIARNDSREGLVVVPINEYTDKEATIAKIKSTFSDDVRVEPGSDGVSGVITPVFKKSNGDDYLYVLVPIKN
jgi:hypothetical protein